MVMTVVSEWFRFRFVFITMFAGTKTSGSKSAAQSKFAKYLDGLGRALSQ